MSGIVTITARVIDGDKARADIKALEDELSKAAKQALEERKTTAAARKEAEATSRARIDAAKAHADAVRDTTTKIVNFSSEERRQALDTAKVIQESARSQILAEKAVIETAKSQAAQARAQAEESRALASARRADAEAARAQTSELRALEAAQRAASRTARETKEGTEGWSDKLKDQAGHVIGMTGHMLLLSTAFSMVTGSFQAFTEGLDTSINSFADKEQSLKTLDIVTSRLGGSIADARGITERFNDEVSSEAPVAQAVRNFETMGLSAATMSLLIERIRDGAIGMGQNVNEQLVLVSRAIKQGNSELLDNIGVVTNVSVMYDEYAKKIGKTVEALSQQDKYQAIVIGVLKETEQYSGLAARASEDLRGKMNAHEKSSKDLATAIGEKMAPAYERWLDALTGINREMTLMANPDFGKSLQKRLLEAQEAVVKAEESAKAIEKTNFGAGLLGEWSTAAAYDRLSEARKALLELQREFDRQHKETPTGKAPPPEQDPKKIKEAEAAAKKEADDQRRLAEELRKDLATIGKTGRDRELADLNLWYQEKLRMAHGNAKLIAQIEQDKVRRLAEINREEAERVKQRADGIESQNMSTMKRLGLTGDANTIQAGDANKAAIEDTHAAFAAHDKMLETKAKADDKSANKLEKAAEKGGDYLADAVGDAIQTGAGILAKSIRTGEAPSGGDMTRAGAGIAGGVAGFMLGGPAGAALGAQIGNAAGDVLGSIFDRHDDEARQAAELQRDAAEKQMEAAKSAVENNITTYERAQDADLRLKVAKGDMTEDQASVVRQERDNDETLKKLRADMEKSGVATTEFDDALNILKYGNRGEAGNRDNASNLIGANNASAIVYALQGNAALLEALKTELGKTDKERVMPGSSPDNPTYTVVTNVPDFRQAFRESTYFRSQMNSGTIRQDGRGINVGKAV